MCTAYSLQAHEKLTYLLSFLKNVSAHEAVNQKKQV